jgi:hypothetical protein
MIRRILICLAAALPLAVSAGAQTCKVKIAVGYTDGEKTEIGFTAEQKKFWEREGAKHYAGFCLDAREPNYLILWTEGLTGGSRKKRRSIDSIAAALPGKISRRGQEPR